MTYDKDDKYMGSSKYLKKDIKKFGRQNFEKEILHTFYNKEDVMEKEKEIVNKEFCYNPNTYNKQEGGVNVFGAPNMFAARDKEGNVYRIYNDDPRYFSGELVGVTKGMIMVRYKNDPDGKCFRVYKNDQRYINGDVIVISKGKITVRNENGICFNVDKNDSRWLSGELKQVTKGLTQHPNCSQLGRKRSDETKKKNSNNAKLRVGEKNSMFGKKHSDETRRKLSEKAKLRKKK